mmetsp:Transcript_5669/g.10611  ORF Transcript_5669/g.10611 Transcript_5669/m.10611 type:complete len:279 (+) Transcript_5669:100-936(+)
MLRLATFTTLLFLVATTVSDQGFDESSADAMLKHYDQDNSGAIERPELEIMLLALEITHDLDEDTLGTLFGHLHTIYDDDDSGAFEGLEFRKLARDLRRPEDVDRTDNKDNPAWLYTTGMKFYEGHGKVQQSYEEAARLFFLASEKGHPGATHSLAVMHRYAQGVEYDPEKAIELFRQAAQMGYVHSMFNLGTILLSSSGHNVSGHVVGPGRQTRASANKGGALDRLRSVWSSLWFGEGPAVAARKRDFEEALSWLKEAAELGSEEALARLQQGAGEL